jgi:Fe-S oxidoreductase
VTMTKLPMLERHRDPLEKCVYCPKLSRASCPVSNVRPREALTPWGKMSATYFLGRGDLPLEAETGAVTWGCTGCLACRERCDHKNEVATVLFDARAELFARGIAPDAAVGAAADHVDRARRSAARARSLRGSERSSPATVGVLVGCGYHLLHTPSGDKPIDELALDVTAALLGERGAKAEVRPVEACCGLPLLHAGDRVGFTRAAEAFAREVDPLGTLIGIDPGCTRALTAFYPAVGVTVRAPKLLIDVAAERVDRFERVESEPPRYHDPCQLGRGLGRYEEPRRILGKIAGAAPREFQRHGSMADCSGGGGLLPQTMKEESALIAQGRIDEHRASGAGTLVTGCSGSLRRFRASGERAEDIVTWMAKALGLEVGAPPLTAPRVSTSSSDG